MSGDDLRPTLVPVPGTIDHATGKRVPFPDETRPKVPASWSKLTLYDRVLRQTGNAHHAANRLREARCFVITERAAERVRDAMQACPEMIAEHSQFAIPPFENMWIEFPSRIMLEGARLSGVGIMGNPTSDLHVGYLITNNVVSVVAEGDDMQPNYLPIRYGLHRPMQIAEQQQAAAWFNVSRMQLDPFLWGHNMHDTLDAEHRRMLRAQHTLDLSDFIEGRIHSTARTAYHTYHGSAGELRNILAVLLMINQPAKVIQTREVPRQRGLVKGKPMAYWGHSLIDIDLDRRRKVNVLAKPRRGTSNFQMRWHSVRGHFFHSHARNADHAHVWIGDLDRERHWHCAHPGCKAQRAWREYPDGRGSAQVGYVDQVRRIKTKEDA